MGIFSILKWPFKLLNLGSKDLISFGDERYVPLACYKTAKSLEPSIEKLEELKDRLENEERMEEEVKFIEPVIKTFLRIETPLDQALQGFYNMMRLQHLMELNDAKDLKELRSVLYQNMKDQVDPSIADEFKKLISDINNLANKERDEVRQLEIKERTLASGDVNIAKFIKSHDMLGEFTLAKKGSRKEYKYMRRVFNEYRLLIEDAKKLKNPDKEAKKLWKQLDHAYEDLMKKKKKLDLFENIVQNNLLAFAYKINTTIDDLWQFINALERLNFPNTPLDELNFKDSELRDLNKYHIGVLDYLKKGVEVLDRNMQDSLIKLKLESERVQEAA